MNSEMYNHFRELVKRKASRMKEDIEQDKKYRNHCHNLLNDKDLLNKMKVDHQLDRAFLIGAVDAMIFDVASALAMPAYARYSSRRKLLKDILTDC